MNRLTNQDYCRAAKRFNCKPAAIKAVAQVESAGDGFLPDGRCIILFERHHFSRFTKRRFDAEHPQISSRSAGGYYGKEKEYQRFNLAFSLDPVAAMMSTSWGKFQIMGFNHAICGYASVHEFVDDMKRSEGDQLDAFCGFVDHNNLDDELRRLDWAGFARGYNGKAYKINRYDEKMAAAYQKFAKENIDCDDILDVDAAIDAIRTDQPSPVAPPLEPTPVEQQAEHVNDNSSNSGQNPSEQPATTSIFGLDRLNELGQKAGDGADKVENIQAQVGKISKSSLFEYLSGKIIALFLGAASFFSEHWLELLIAAVAIMIATMVYAHFSKGRAHDRWMAIWGK